MEKSLDVKIQYFANLLNQQIMEIESGLLLLELTHTEEDRRVFRCEVYQEILKEFEDVFENTIYKESFG